MAVFTVRATLAPQWPPRHISELTPDALIGVIAGSVVRQFLVAPTACDATIELCRERHDIALQNLIGGAEQLGLRVVEAVIVRWTTAVAEAAIAGMIVGTVGGAAAKNPMARLATACAGTAIGAYLGQFIHYEIERYLARPDQFGGWQLSESAPPAGRQIRLAVA
jgi:hypothetical protein